MHLGILIEIHSIFEQCDKDHPHPPIKKTKKKQKKKQQQNF
jgi:hypothetical protein